MCVVSCPYVIYYPTVMVRYSLFVLKVPLNLKQANKQAHHLISSAIYDQFAFRPPGSTTAALIYLMYHLTNMIDKLQFWSRDLYRHVMLHFCSKFRVDRPIQRRYIGKTIFIMASVRHLEFEKFRFFVKFACSEWKFVSVYQI